MLDMIAFVTWSAHYSSVIRDVECEPMLQPVVNKAGYPKTALLADDAHPDIRAHGFWRQCQNAFHSSFTVTLSRTSRTIEW